ncbi:MAG TPA: hypothetical protein VKA84_18240 [Gemmatimonadaceae bacterium]|nr:hypothetical protein [Gemmatimonadaceae bacterium]
MDQQRQAEPTTATADSPEQRLELNKDTLHDLDAPQGAAIKGGALPSIIYCHSDLCLTTTVTRA